MLPGLLKVGGGGVQKAHGIESAPPQAGSFLPAPVCWVELSELGSYDVDSQPVVCVHSQGGAFWRADLGVGRVPEVTAWEARLIQQGGC